MTDGLFTVQLDFGAAAFPGEARWLAIAVQCSGDSAYTALTPRQALTAAPYADYALSAPWSGLSGVTAGFADGVDNDTTYTAGTGLTLSGGHFSLLVPYRLPQSCANGQVPKRNGAAWVCADDSGGNGDITAVNASTGLTGGGTSGDVTLSADTTYLQHRVSGACLPGNYLKAINPDGSVVCATPSIQIVENFCQINVGQNSGSCSASCPEGYLLTGGGWNSECGTDGGGNIDTDPLFVDANGGNLRLGFGFPAIETGTNSVCPATDLDGLPRPADGDANSTAICDMGAYEAGTMLCSTPYTFNDQSGVSVEVLAADNLACLYVDEMGLNHPNATPGIQTGRY